MEKILEIAGLITLSKSDFKLLDNIDGKNIKELFEEYSYILDEDIVEENPDLIIPIGFTEQFNNNRFQEKYNREEQEEMIVGIGGKFYKLSGHYLDMDINIKEIKKDDLIFIINEKIYILNNELKRIY